MCHMTPLFFRVLLLMGLHLFIFTLFAMLLFPKRKVSYIYSKTCLKQPLKKKTENWFSRPIIAYCRSKVLQNAPKGEFCNTFDLHKATFVFKTFFCLFLSGCLRQVLLSQYQRSIKLKLQYILDNSSANMIYYGSLKVSTISFNEK